MTLTIVNNPPIAGNNSYTTHGGLFQAAPGFLNNDSDPDGDPLNTNDVKGCQILPHSYMCKYADGSLSYSPNYGWVGQENHTFNICDNLGACTSETLTFNSINQAPVTVLDFYVAYSGTLAVPAPGPIANDFDPESDTISLAGWSLTCTSTPHGWLCRNSMASFSYTPNTGYTGLDSYTYQICDNLGGCSFGTMYFFAISAAPGEKPPYSCCPAIHLVLERFPRRELYQGRCLIYPYPTFDKNSRLKRVSEGTNWQQEYDYDRWGNRTINAAGTWLGNPSALPNQLLNETQFETGNLATTNRLYAPGDAHYSLSHIVIFEDGRLKVFRSINCPVRGDKLEDVINYVRGRLAQDKNRERIIRRLRNYKKYGFYGSLDHAAFICNHGKPIRE